MKIHQALIKKIHSANPTALIDQDPWLEPQRDKLTKRGKHLEKTMSTILKYFSNFDDFTTAHEYFGLNRGKKGAIPGVWYREWAPEAISLSLTGDFNNWDRRTHALEKDEHGVWSIFLPDSEFKDRLVDGSKVKVHVLTYQGSHDRIPAYIRQVGRDDAKNTFYGIYKTVSKYNWQHTTPKTPKNLRIYECHIGMAQEAEKVGSYDEFRTNVLPRIEAQGYNAIQIMAIQQHPYYGSFGYQVSNLFSPSHYFGNPESLRKLIDEAHKRGIIVLLDIIHSHMVKNVDEGLNEFDGTGYQYFHDGDKGNHPDWDTKLYNYAKIEVLQLLLSNVRYWMEEFNFDGFRFDGVTSMIYKNHGIGTEFDHYDTYFNDNVDTDAITFLQLANLLIHSLKKDAVSIAEDVSGMPGMARPVQEGGLGFDYRLAMGIPDYWIKILKHKSDEEWNITEIFQTMVNRRHHEKHVAYAESHDQAMVGDKTIAFWLMDKEMYWSMEKTNQNIIIDRGIALHNMIRLLTFSLAGEAWLNFMGNEFGHPEWIDFPREGNNYSFKHARRLWSVADNELLKYQYLLAFDQAMNELDSETTIISDPFIELIGINEENKLLIYRRGPLVFAFNFHSKNSYTDLRVGVPDQTDYEVILNSDDPRYGGFGRVEKHQKYVYEKVAGFNRSQSIQIYLPNRSALVFAPIST